MVDSTRVFELDLIKSVEAEQLRRCCLKLPARLLNKPAAQTLGALIAATDKETFMAVAKIAELAVLPTKTVRNHLEFLHDDGWIINTGRQRTRGGVPRRTCTIRITQKTRDAAKTYGILPVWACLRLKSGELLSWASKAVLSIVLSRLAGKLKAVERLNGHADTDPEAAWGSIENIQGDEFRLSANDLHEETGLDHKSIWKAKNELCRHGIITVTNPRGPGHWKAPDIIMPNDAFRARFDRFGMSFGTSGKVGQ